MSMPVEKAKIVLKAYKDKHYNAKEALTSVGYGLTTAEGAAGRTMDRASASIARSGDRDAILEYLGTTPEEIAREYMAVVKQNKNYPAKLRAMEPLVRKQGIVFNEEQTKVTVPVLNVTMSAPDAPQDEKREEISAPIVEPIQSDSTAQQGQES